VTNIKITAILDLTLLYNVSNLKYLEKPKKGGIIMKILKNDARKIAILSAFPSIQNNGKIGALEVVEKLGYIQIDTISVIQRAHHHTIWSRYKKYKPKMLNELLKEGKLFEHWGHAASYLPIKHFRYSLPLKKVFIKNNKWAQERIKQFGNLMHPVKSRIKNEGPLSSKDFENPYKGTKSQWANWKPAKFVLEMLLWNGDLMVTERRNFHKVYDLTERVLNTEVDVSFPTEKELGEFIVRKVIDNFGLASQKEIFSYIHLAEKRVILESLHRLLDKNEINKIDVDGLLHQEFYCSNVIMENLLKNKLPSDVKILSPFDNFTIHRDRLLNIFDFDYKLECYLPAKKRKYGYFVLPVLWKDKIVARIDTKADRKKKVLNIIKFYWEKDIIKKLDFKKAFKDELDGFCKFCECDRILDNSGQMKVLKI